VLEELLTGKLLELRDDPREPPVAQPDLVLLPALAAKTKDDPRPADVDVAIPQRRQAERSVRARVFLVADADRGLLQEAYDRREHLFARYALASKVALYAPAHPSEQPSLEGRGGRTSSRPARRASARDSGTACGP